MSMVGAHEEVWVNFEKLFPTYPILISYKQILGVMI